MSTDLSYYYKLAILLHIKYNYIKILLSGELYIVRCMLTDNNTHLIKTYKLIKTNVCISFVLVLNIRTKIDTLS